VEASIVDAEDGQTSRTIALPDELVTLVERGAAFEWHSEIQVNLVRQASLLGIKLTSLDQVLSQLLAWMAILDHFEDAVSTIPRRISSSDDLRSLGHFAGRIWISSIRQNS